MSDRVVVRVPATVANLGPGFDAMGLALTWYDEVRVERHEGALEITASGLGAGGIRRDESNSIVQGLRAVLGEAPRVRIHKMISVAFARGFGSSAGSIVAGLVAGRALGGTEHSNEDLVRLATELEGHADNVAPCLLGGVTIVAGDRIKRIPAPRGLRVLACVAPMGLSTKAARGALPDSIPREDAVATIGRAALLAAALATGDTEFLLEATEDVFHQPPRFELMPDSGSLVRSLRSRGIAAFLSGAGPSVSALVPEARSPEAERAAKETAPDGWDIRLEEIDDEGAAIVDAR